MCHIASLSNFLSCIKDWQEFSYSDPGSRMCGFIVAYEILSRWIVINKSAYFSGFRIVCNDFLGTSLVLFQFWISLSLYFSDMSENIFSVTSYSITNISVTLVSPTKCCCHVIGKVCHIPWQCYKSSAISATCGHEGDCSCVSFKLVADVIMTMKNTFYASCVNESGASK